MIKPKGPGIRNKRKIKKKNEIIYRAKRDTRPLANLVEKIAASLSNSKTFVEISIHCVQIIRETKTMTNFSMKSNPKGLSAKTLPLLLIISKLYKILSYGFNYC